MISEEYAYEDIKEYLYSKIDILITGEANEEERSHFFQDEWIAQGKQYLTLKIEDGGLVLCRLFHSTHPDIKRVDLSLGLPRYLKELNVTDMNVLLDMSGLSHVLLMFLTKQFLLTLSPRRLFSAYIRPQKYKVESDDIGCQLSQRIGAVSCVPGFSKRENGKQTVCAFLGFEGVRLKGVLEVVNTVERLIPIVAFPSGTPQWYNIAMRNSMNILQSQPSSLSVYKCYSESVFGAVELLEKTVTSDEKVVLAPLGTRPHSMACAIYASRNKSARIMYDFAVESNHRAIGIDDITIYHLSTFIKN